MTEVLLMGASQEEITEEFKKALENCTLYEGLDDKKYLLNKIGELHGMAIVMEKMGFGVETLDDFIFDKYLHFMDLQSDILYADE